MQPSSLTVTGIGTSAVIPPDTWVNPFGVSVGVSIPTGTATYTVEHTFDNVFAPGFTPGSATWFPNAGATGVTSAKELAYTTPVRGIRVNVTASTGTVRMTVMQVGGG